MEVAKSIARAAPLAVEGVMKAVHFAATRQHKGNRGLQEGRWEILVLISGVVTFKVEVVLLGALFQHPVNRTSFVK